MEYNQLEVLTEASYKISNKNTNVLKNDLYKTISSKLSNTTYFGKYKKALASFIEKRSDALYDTVPCSRLFFGESDKQEFYEALSLSEGEIKSIIKNTYFGDIPNFTPKAAKDEFTQAMMAAIKYFFDEKKDKELEISCIYLAFSGKFYPSIHYASYPTVEPVRYVMEFVVNNRLSNKYDIVREGSVIGAISSICKTWIDTYKDKFKSYTDEDTTYLIQQLHSRISSFMKNIAEEYYKAYEEKDTYMTYDSDSFSDDDYHMADNDSLKIQRASEKAINKINNSSVDYNVCKMCADSNVKPLEVKSIMESILGTKENTEKVRRLVDLIVTTYFTLSDAKEKNVTDISFITFTLAAKPNVKNPELIEIKEIVRKFLEENSIAYLKRRSREATKNSYEKSVLMYFTLIIHNANRNA